MSVTVSIIVPALNEGGNVAQAINAVAKVCAVAGADYEILVFNDGSSDRTGEIADHIAKRNPRVRVFHNPHTMGLGYIFQRGIEASTKSFLMFFPGDADMASWSLGYLIRQAHTADLVITYPRNISARPFLRRILSVTFVKLLNILLGLSLRYYTGSFICKVRSVEKLPLVAQGFAALFEFKIHMLKAGCTYREIPFDHVGRTQGRSKAFRLANIIDTSRMVLVLFLMYRLGRGKSVYRQT